MRQLLALFSLLAALFAICAAKHGRVRGPAFASAQNDTKVIISNDFIYLEFNLKEPQIDVLAGDFHGTRNYGKSIIPSKSTTFAASPLKQDYLNRRGIVLERTMQSLKTYTSSLAASPLMSFKIENNATTGATRVSIFNVTDDALNPVLSSTWIITLQKHDRFFNLQVSVSVISNPQDSDPTDAPSSVKISFYNSLPSLFAMYDMVNNPNGGIVQMMYSASPYFMSNETLVRFYSLGNQLGSIDIQPNSQDQEFLKRYNTILTSAMERDFNLFYGSGIQFLLAGELAAPRPNEWTYVSERYAKPITLGKGSIFRLPEVRISANQYDFPSITIPTTTTASSDDSDGNIDFEHLRSMYTSTYASPTGALVTYQYKGMISPSIATPRHAYQGMYTFFDPDSWLSISAMMYMGDRFLMKQCKQLIEASMFHMLTTTGQVPHHFEFNRTSDRIEPVNVAISGATQTGPNCFWIAALLQYVKYSGDYEFLKQHFSQFERGLRYLIEMIDPQFGLLNAPGPLFIDVFRRSNFTADSNAMMVHVLREASEAYLFMGNASFAQELQKISDSIVMQMNKLLWRDDHYITQLNPDGTTRDFVDYDANLLAIAFKVSPLERSLAIMKRVMSGKCVHANPLNPRPTYVSEKYYGKADCYLENTGDSEVTMGRIGWAEAHARAQLNDMQSVYKYVLNPIMKDLFNYTWLYERYTCESKPTHNNYYIEYPEMLVMIIHELVYGINIGLNKIVIAPSEEKTAFEYHVGNVHVVYSRERIVLDRMPLPDGFEKQIEIRNLHKNTNYALVEYRAMKRRVLASNQMTDDKGTLVLNRVEVSQNVVLVIEKM